MLKTTRLICLPRTRARKPSSQPPLVRVIVVEPRRATLAGASGGPVVEAPGVPAGVPLGVPSGVVPNGGADPEAQLVASTLLVSSVTAPLRASVLPMTDAPVFRVMLVSASTLPAKAVPVPSVAELVTFQKTLHGEAPLISTTALVDAVVSVEPI